MFDMIMKYTKQGIIVCQYSKQEEKKINMMKKYDDDGFG